MTRTFVIRRGLRRLDFNTLEDEGPSGPRSHVVVEFAVSEPLAEDQLVQIHLGARAGIERLLQGPARLLAEEKIGKNLEYRYRLEGDVG